MIISQEARTTGVEAVAVGEDIMTGSSSKMTRIIVTTSLVRVLVSTHPTRDPGK